MNAGHLTDGELLALLYVPSDSDHAAKCQHCADRLERLRAQRRELEDVYSPDDEVSFEFLAAQRRRIYAKIDREANAPWWILRAPRWASAAALLVLFAGGAAVIEQHHTAGLEQARAKVSDAELAAEVSQFADSPEPRPAAPLQALFQD